MQVSERTYEELALREPKSKWELTPRGLRRKPDMTTEHNGVVYELHGALYEQLDRRDYIVSTDLGKVRVGSRYYIPDLCVIPRAYQQRLKETPGTFEVYGPPLPLVVEVWSLSTGDYDVEDKLVEYQARGDAEIWLLHPYKHTLMAWRKQPDGTYTLTEYAAGTGVIVPIASLPGVQIALDELFR